jgi:hypothetical protein
MRKFLNVLTLLAFTSILLACKKEDEEIAPTVQMINTSIEVTALAGEESSLQVMINGFTFSEFYLSTRNASMKYIPMIEGVAQGNAKQINSNSSLQESTARRRNLILVRQGRVSVETLGEGESPEGVYSEMEFQMIRSNTDNPNNPMFQKSLLITGTIDGKFARIWTEMERKINAQVDGSEGIHLVDGVGMMLILNLEEVLKDIDFSTALDLNGDGRIEISPNSPDGNEFILRKIEANLLSAWSISKM